MNQYLDALHEAATVREQHGLTRTAHSDQLDGVRFDLASNDYLGLRRDKRIIHAAEKALHTTGSGAGASRLVTGTHVIHIQLEEALSTFMGHEAALVFSTGYHANLSVMTCLGTADTLIISDAHNHASLIDGMRLAKGRVQVVPHLDVEAVRDALVSRETPRAIIVVESVFSVLGDAAPLRELLALAEEFDALLVVDEAHGLGVGGSHGEGLVASLKNEPGFDRIIVTATLSKSLASQGGVVLGPRVLREHLLNVARPFIFDTGLAPAAAGAALGALEVLRANPDLPQRIRHVSSSLSTALDVPESAGAVLSKPMPSPQEAVAAVERTRRMGVRVGCFRPPSTPDGISRLRLTANVGLSDADLAKAITLLHNALELV